MLACYTAVMGGVVYILASRAHGTLYTGVTSDLLKRMVEHREDMVPSFTSRYGVKRLVWYEAHDDISQAILREKRIKEWRRQWKINLIEHDNPGWNDLSRALFGLDAFPPRQPLNPPPSRY